MTTTLKHIEQFVGEGRVRENVQIATYTTLKIGGPVDFYLEAENDQDIIQAVKASHDLHIPLHIFGGVSNVVIGNEGLRGLVVKNLVSYKNVLEDTHDFVLLRVSAGYNMTRLAKETAQDGYEGLEYHLGLPGTVGGGIFMNSGWYAHPPSKYVGDPVESIQLVASDGTVRTEKKEYFQFDYDYSILQKTHEIVLSVDFKLKKADPEVLLQRGQDALEYRKRTQPFGVATSGCFFRNVDGESVGKIIDEAGLKGYSIGGAQVSNIHANFIENTGTATAADVLALVSHIKKVVKEKRGIDLEEEVICL